MKRSIIFSVFAFTALALIGWIFWQQEARYLLPTPRPPHFKDVSLGTPVNLSAYGISSGNPAMLHFFNPHCPCSRFNMTEFERMVARYKSKANVYVVIQSDNEADAEDFRSKYALNVPVLLDSDGGISDQCGIYATPQSVLLDKESKLYFKGNYNKARYCSRRETSFAEMAMDALLKDEKLPRWITTELTVPYGCPLPSDGPAQNLTIEVSLNDTL
jgi:hypothetical protein